MAPSDQTILITGASGFLAAHVVKAFLAKGYKVRGTVRSEAAAEGVRKTHPDHADQLSFAIVTDLVHDVDGINKAVEGVQGVIHTASPFSPSNGDFEVDVLRPAIDGTKNVLKAVAAHAPDVKRVIVTSSHAAVQDPRKQYPPDYDMSEKDWNNLSFEEAKAGPWVFAYTGSKALAEKAAWKFVEEEKPGFDLATLNPPMIFGPVVHAVGGDRKVNTSANNIFMLMDGSQTEVPPDRVRFMVDVRDVAEAHLQAYERPEAGGKRFVIASDIYSHKDLCEIIIANFPELESKVPDPSKSTTGKDPKPLDNSRSKEILGLSYIPKEQTVIDTVNTLKPLLSA